jgi:phospholipase C
MAPTPEPIDPRALLRRGALLGGAAALGGALPTALPASGGTRRAGRVPRTQPDSVLNHPAVEAPIDTVVVLMMENRSVDHHLGWLATDPIYIEEGRRRYGHRFRIDADNTQRYVAPDGRRVDTWYLPGSPSERNPYRRCDHPDPGHGWASGRAQRDGGFLADGSENDEFALGYYASDDVPVYADLVRRFTTFDRYHCSLLSSTYPNRAYLHSAQSGGLKNNDLPTGTVGYQWETIWDLLLAAGVPSAYYFTDLPVPRCGAHDSSLSRARSRSTSPRARRARCPASCTSIPASRAICKPTITPVAPTRVPHRSSSPTCSGRSPAHRSGSAARSS